MSEEEASVRREASISLNHDSVSYSLRPTGSDNTSPRSQKSTSTFPHDSVGSDPGERYEVSVLDDSADFLHEGRDSPSLSRNQRFEGGQSPVERSGAASEDSFSRNDDAPRGRRSPVSAVVQSGRVKKSTRRRSHTSGVGGRGSLSVRSLSSVGSGDGQLMGSPDDVHDGVIRVKDQNSFLDEVNSPSTFSILPVGTRTLDGKSSGRNSPTISPVSSMVSPISQNLSGPIDPDDSADHSIVGSSPVFSGLRRVSSQTGIDEPNGPDNNDDLFGESDNERNDSVLADGVSVVLQEGGGSDVEILAPENADGSAMTSSIRSRSPTEVSASGSEDRTTPRTMTDGNMGANNPPSTMNRSQSHGDLRGEGEKAGGGVGETQSSSGKGSGSSSSGTAGNAGSGSSAGSSAGSTTGSSAGSTTGSSVGEKSDGISPNGDAEPTKQPPEGSPTKNHGTGMPVTEKKGGDGAGSVTGSSEAVQYSPCKRYFRTRKRLGKGSFKIAYEATDTLTGKELAWVAVDLSKISHSDRGRVKHETKLLLSLKHPFVLRIESAWADEKRMRVCFITPKASKTLKQLIEHLHPAKEEVIKKYCRQLLEALAYLHSMDIIHRDLKADNIFIDGGTGDIRLGDFGMAGFLKLPGQRKGKLSTMLGTPGFIAPEMLNEVGYDEKVDIWAFGMVVLEMVTNEYPYMESHENLRLLLAQEKKGVLPKCLETVKDGSLSNFISRCLVIKPEDRPSARKLLEQREFDVFCGDEDLRKSVMARVNGYIENSENGYIENSEKNDPTTDPTDGHEVRQGGDKGQGSRNASPSIPSTDGGKSGDGDATDDSTAGGHTPSGSPNKDTPSGTGDSSGDVSEHSRIITHVEVAKNSDDDTSPVVRLTLTLANGRKLLVSRFDFATHNHLLAATQLLQPMINDYPLLKEIVKSRGEASVMQEIANDLQAGLEEYEARYIERKQLTESSKILSLLTSLNMKKYLDNFLKEEVSTSDLQHLTDEELRKLVPAMGPRKRLVRKIEVMVEKAEAGKKNAESEEPSSQPAPPTGSDTTATEAVESAKNSTTATSPAVSDSSTEHTSAGAVPGGPPAVSDGTPDEKSSPGPSTPVSGGRSPTKQSPVSIKRTSTEDILSVLDETTSKANSGRKTEESATQVGDADRPGEGDTEPSPIDGSGSPGRLSRKVRGKRVPTDFFEDEIFNFMDGDGGSKGRGEAAENTASSPKAGSATSMSTASPKSSPNVGRSTPPTGDSVVGNVASVQGSQHLSLDRERVGSPVLSPESSPSPRMRNVTRSGVPNLTLLLSGLGSNPSSSPTDMDVPSSNATSAQGSVPGVTPEPRPGSSRDDNSLMDELIPTRSVSNPGVMLNSVHGSQAVMVPVAGGDEERGTKAVLIRGASTALLPPEPFESIDMHSSEPRGSESDVSTEVDEGASFSNRTSPADRPSSVSPDVVSVDKPLSPKPAEDPLDDLFDPKLFAKRSPIVDGGADAPEKIENVCGLSEPEDSWRSSGVGTLPRKVSDEFVLDGITMSEHLDKEEKLPESPPKEKPGDAVMPSGSDDSSLLKPASKGLSGVSKLFETTPKKNQNEITSTLDNDSIDHESGGSEAGGASEQSPE